MGFKVGESYTFKDAQTLYKSMKTLCFMTAYYAL